MRMHCKEMLAVSRRLWAVSRWSVSPQEKLWASRGEVTEDRQEASGCGSDLLHTHRCRFPSAEVILSLREDEEGLYLYGENEIKSS